MHELSPDGETNFWAFYEKNSKVIDECVYQNISHFRCVEHTVQDDIHQDILMALDRCKVLEDYKPKESAFNTFLTGKIRFYIQHWFAKQHNPVWRPFPSDENKGDKDLRFERVYYSDWNGVLAEEEILVPTDIPVYPSIEEDLAWEETLKIFRSYLDDSLSNVFDFLANSYSKTQIAEFLNVTKASVSFKVLRMRDVLKQRLLSE